MNVVSDGQEIIIGRVGVVDGIGKVGLGFIRVVEIIIIISVEVERDDVISQISKGGQASRVATAERRAHVCGIFSENVEHCPFILGHLINTLL